MYTSVPKQRNGRLAPSASEEEFREPALKPGETLLSQGEQSWGAAPFNPAVSLLRSASPLMLCCCSSSSVAKYCPTLCDPMNCSMAGFFVLHDLLEFAQTHVHWVSEVIQPSHPLSPPSPLALSPSQNQCLFQWVCCSHQLAKVLELQLQHQSFQRIFRVDFL